MEIIETTPFARCRDELFDDEQFRRFQEHLVLNPTVGVPIPGGGGVRVIYCFRSKTNRLFLFFGYHKNQGQDLTQAQIKGLAQIIERL